MLVTTTEVTATKGELLAPYYRVSTPKQGKSRLGLEGQDLDYESYRARIGGVTGQVFVEVETGTKKRTRPELAEALAYCQRTGATLVIAKLDRLARNVHFISGLMESGVPFVCCDNPEATPVLLHVMAAFAEHEAEAISCRTRTALNAYKVNKHVSKATIATYGSLQDVPAEVVEATAGKLGAALPQCRNLTDEGRRKGAETTGKRAREQAIAANSDVAHHIIFARAEKKSYATIADELNQAGKTTRTGAPWRAAQVHRAYERVKADRL